MSGAEFYADPAVGGSGTTYTQSDFESGTYVTQFFAAQGDTVNIAQFVADTANDVAADALSAQNAAFTPATSTSNLSITGSAQRTFTTQSGKTFPRGYKIRAASAADVSNWMVGYVDSYSGTSLVVNMVDSNGSGTHADWEFSPAGEGAGDVMSTRAITTTGASNIATGGGDLTADRNIVVNKSSAAEILAGTEDGKAMTPKGQKDAAAPVVLTHGSTVTPDLSAGADFTWAVGGNCTLANMTNKVVGRKGVIVATMGGSGSYSITSFGSDYKKLDTFELSPGVGDVTRIEYHVISASVVHLVSSGPYA